MRICARCGLERQPDSTYCEDCKAERRRITSRARRWAKQGWTSSTGRPICRYCARLKDRMRTPRMCWDCYTLRARQKRRANREAYRAKTREWRRNYRKTERGRQSEIEAVQRWRERHHENYLASQRESARRRRSDPVLRAQDLVMRRIDARLNGRVAGVKQMTNALDAYVPPPGANHVKPLVDAAPLRQFLKWQFGAWQIKELADWIGEDDRHISRIVNGDQHKVSLYVADRILVGADCTHMLALLYPEAA